MAKSKKKPELYVTLKELRKIVKPIYDNYSIHRYPLDVILCAAAKIAKEHAK